MTDRRRASGTAGGVDVEPLRGGMREQEAGGPSPGEGGQPPAPYHAPAVQEGGLAPTGGDDPERGSTPREGTPPDPGRPQPDPDAQLDAERRDHENEGGNAPRRG